MLEKIKGIGEVRAKSIKEFDDFHLAEEEIKFIEKYKIKTLFLTDLKEERELQLLQMSFPLFAHFRRVK